MVANAIEGKEEKRGRDVERKYLDEIEWEKTWNVIEERRESKKLKKTERKYLDETQKEWKMNQNERKWKNWWWMQYLGEGSHWKSENTFYS